MFRMTKCFLMSSFFSTEMNTLGLHQKGYTKAKQFCNKQEMRKLKKKNTKMLRKILLFELKLLLIENIRK